MPTLNDAMMSGLEARGFNSGPLNARLFAWAGSAGATGSLNDRLMSFLGGSGTLNDRWMQFVSAVGITVGTWNDRMLAYWLAPVALTVIPPATQFWTIGVPVNLTIQAYAGPSDVLPYSWTLSPATLPTGLTFTGGNSLTATITGTPTGGTTTGFPTITINDSAAHTSSGQFSWNLPYAMSVAYNAGTRYVANNTNLGLANSSFLTFSAWYLPNSFISGVAARVLTWAGILVVIKTNVNLITVALAGRTAIPTVTVGSYKFSHLKITIDLTANGPVIPGDGLLTVVLNGVTTTYSLGLVALPLATIPFATGASCTIGASTAGSQAVTTCFGDTVISNTLISNPAVSWNNGVPISPASLSPNPAVKMLSPPAAAWNGGTANTGSGGAFTAAGAGLFTDVLPATPKQFVFTAQTGVLPSTPITSDSILITGLYPTDAAAITISGTGQFSKNGAPLATTGTATNGDAITVTLTSSAASLGVVTSTLTVGGTSAVFSVTTQVITTNFIALEADNTSILLEADSTDLLLEA